MDQRTPAYWVNEPVRRALDGVVYRWLALFGVAVGSAVVHRLAGGTPLDRFVHVGLPIFLCSYIALHLVGRLWRRRGSPDGWQQATQADHGTVVVTRSIGWVAFLGSALALVCPLGNFGDPYHFLTEVLLWTPLLLPLYSLAVWVTIDCAEHRLGRGVEESRRRVNQYWQRIASGAGTPS